MEKRRWFLLLVLGFLAGCPSPSKRPLKLSPSELAEATVGKAYMATIAVSDNDTPVSDMIVDEEDLPPGLTFNFPGGSTGQLTGTPTKAGRYSIIVTVGCFGTNRAGQGARKMYTLIIK